MAKKLLMRYTEVPARKTVGDISSALVEAGAKEVSVQYENGTPVALRWVLHIGNSDYPFQMPSRTRIIYERLEREKGSYSVTERERQLLSDRAERIGWRQLYRWVQAQLAMVDTGMVEASEVFLPYLYYPERDLTLFEVLKGSGMKMLEGGSPK